MYFTQVILQDSTIDIKTMNICKIASKNSKDSGVGGFQFLAKQLTLFKPRGVDYVHHIINASPRFLNGATSLRSIKFVALSHQANSSHA